MSERKTGEMVLDIRCHSRCEVCDDCVAQTPSFGMVSCEGLPLFPGFLLRDLRLLRKQANRPPRNVPGGVALWSANNLGGTLDDPMDCWLLLLIQIAFWTPHAKRVFSVY